LVNPAPILAVWPIRLEYFSGWEALGFFLLLAVPIVLLGMRSLNGLGKVRQRVAIVLRLAVMLLIVLILGGIRLQKTSKDLEVMVLRDISTSTTMVQDFPAKTLKDSVDNYLQTVAATKDKPPDDKIGEISFQQDALIDALPNTHLSLGSSAMREACTGTDPAAAIQLGLATMQKDAMHRLLLIWDGNPTLGDLDSAVSAAVAQHVPIDVMPLHYDVQHEVMLDKIVAPTWRRKNEPFTLDIYVKSTNDFPVTGKLMVTDQGVPMDLDLSAPGIQTTRGITLPAGSADHPAQVLEQVKVPAQESSGVHQFHATFDTDQPGANVSVGGGGGNPPVDTLTTNNAGDAFTYVQGKGRILYVDNVDGGGGDILGKALNEEGVEITDADHVTPDQFPSTLIQLQNYDAIILANVPYGPGGLSDDQQKNLTSYVHELGGGLVMIGGPNTFGAGGWQGKKLEEILPVDMDIPAQRQIPKGALVMVMHSCEFPDGNYFGEQCAIKAIETLSSQDEVGIVTYNWGGGPNGSGSNWDFPLQPKGDGSKPIAAAKQMQVGDMPSFEDSMSVALHGGGGDKGLIDSNAKQKHVIIISDGDPAAPSAALVQEYKDAKVSVSTVSVYPHDTSGSTLADIARELKGKSYGPISANFAQLPQIFVKEATVVRRTLINENENGILLRRRPVNSDMMKGIGDPLPMVRGYVVTSRKANPQIQSPIVALSGTNVDPMLSTWQTGLGRAAVYTSDASDQWGVNWVSSPDYNKFWAQVVRGVARPPMSNQFDVAITQDASKGHIVVEGRDKDTGFMNFLNISGKVVGPDSNQQPMDEHLVQTGPGRYEGDFDMNDAGTYVAVMQYRDQDGNEGFLPVSGLSMNSSPEMRDLKSDDALLKDVADRTGGRVLPAFDAENANLFSRDNLAPAVSSLPIWDQLIPVLLALILIDIATRRIAWDWVAIKRYVGASAGFVRSFTTTRQVETRGSLDALKRVRSDVETKPAAAQPPKPDPKAKFDSTSVGGGVKGGGVKGGGVEGDITTIVGGATDKPIPSAPKKVEPKGTQTPGGMSNLMEAKRRAQQQIRDREKGNP
jgi:uncharacterized membrane protein